MALISKPNTFSAGATIVASEHNDNFDTIYNDYNGGITNANIAAGADIKDTKLAQITTANKVAATAVEDKFLRNDGNDSTSGSLGATLFTPSTAGSASTPTTNSLYSDNIIHTWVVFDGTGTNPITISSGFNIDGTVTKTGTGDYTITFDNDFANTNYCVVTGVGAGVQLQVGTKATGSVQILVVDDTNGSSAPADDDDINVIITGVLA